MSQPVRVAFLIAFIIAATAPAATAQQTHDRDHPSAVLLGGFNLDLSGEPGQGFTRIDPSLDFFVAPRWAIGARAIHETSYGDGEHALWSAGPHVSFFPLEEERSWALGTTRPYAHGGVSYTRIDREQFGETRTYDGVGVYAGVGVTHSFVAGVGVFGEATLIGGQSYTSGSETLDLRFGVSFTP